MRQAKKICCEHNRWDYILLVPLAQFTFHSLKQFFSLFQTEATRYEIQVAGISVYLCGVFVPGAA